MPMPLVPQRKAYRILAVVCVFFVSAALYIIPNIPWVDLSIYPSVGSLLWEPPSSGICSTHDVVHGVWKLDRVFETKRNVTDRYGLEWLAEVRCDPINSLNLPLDSFSDEERWGRISNVTAYTLYPKRDCQVHHSDASIILKRLLRSSQGITVIGDSIAGDFAFGLQSILQYLPGYFYRVNHPTLGNLHVDIYLKKDHPLTPNLLASAGVLPSRLEVPVLRYRRHHHLISATEIDTIFSSISKDFDPAKVSKLTTDWWPAWISEMESSQVEMIPPIKEEPSILVISVGPHWTFGELGQKLTEDNMRDGYKAMLDVIEEKTKGLPYPLSIFWRTASPGHEDCQVEFEMDNDRTDWLSRVEAKEDVYQHNFFAWMNQLAAERFELDRPPLSFEYIDNAAPEERQNPPIRLLDVWPMSIKRPDAHLSPPRDCLHWCRPGLLDFWHMLLWHMVIEESRNQDYVYQAEDI